MWRYEDMRCLPLEIATSGVSGPHLRRYQRSQSAQWQNIVSLFIQIYVHCDDLALILELFLHIT